ncbi:MAG TPA: sulfatase-like hydrolase/transferase [Chitinophagaceae bacterium]
MKRFFKVWFFTFLLFHCHCTGHAQQQSRPNVLVMVIDDMGWGDVSYNGSKLVPTPNIDKLAKQGISFSNSYVTAAVCAPSRCGIVSGAYQEKFGMQINADYPSYTIPENHKLIPETMKSAGYNTALIGKWHVSRKPETIFDEVRDPIEVSSNYFPDSNGFYGGTRLPIVGWKKEGKGEEYLTDRLTRQVMEYFDKTKSRKDPFFLYVGFNAVHNPWQAQEKYYKKLAYIKEDHLRVYAAQIAALDDDIGLIMASLKKNQLDKNTFIVVVSDNGPAMAGNEIEDWEKYTPGKQYQFGQTNGLRGHKAQMFEGGIRTPMIMYYPARLGAPRTYNDMVSSLDIYPTICSITGVRPAGETRLDGVDLVPFIRGEKRNPPHQLLFWRRLNVGAVRLGVWKLYIDNTKAYLYNLKTDAGETTDVSDANPEMKDRLWKAWTEWGKDHPANASKGKKSNVPE